MTADEVRIAIAEACGWKWYRRPATGPWAAKPHRSLYHPSIAVEYVATLKEADMTERQCNEAFIWREGMIPDYPNDLNAMHEAWSTLDDARKRKFYSYLSNMPGMCRLVSKNVRSQHYLIIAATARQRAEAFLRTVGKWKD